MKEIVSGVVIETEYDGVTLGAIQTSAGVIMIDAPINVKDAQVWRASCGHSGNGSDRLLVLLDEHYDRCLGARALRCPIIAHEKTAQAITGRNSAGKPQPSHTGSIWEALNDVNSVHWAHPEITFTNEMSVNWEDEPLLLEHHPGPSRGSIWAVLPERKIAFVGDTLMVNQPPFLATADLETWDESLEILKSARFKDFILISGRGELVTREDAKEMQKFLKKVDHLAEKNADSKNDLDEIEAVGASLVEDFKARNKAEMEVFRARLAYGFSQLCLNYLSKKVP
jgi:glyoxylase-like metal-dependent hydrolase (beta-lactamase superfamily II)